MHLVVLNYLVTYQKILQLLFPVPFAEDVKGLRMSAFVDAGNVYKVTYIFVLAASYKIIY
ncbi:MAG TPA: hypothetical protein EYP87_04245 [Flavobacteriaceae bacterium]|nr:hypothetical protein [Flavobacteriaceae bacterium]